MTTAPPSCKKVWSTCSELMRSDGSSPGNELSRRPNTGIVQRPHTTLNASVSRRWSYSSVVHVLNENKITRRTRPTKVLIPVQGPLFVRSAVVTVTPTISTASLAANMLGSEGSAVGDPDLEDSDVVKKLLLHERPCPRAAHQPILSRAFRNARIW